MWHISPSCILHSMKSCHDKYYSKIKSGCMTMPVYFEIKWTFCFNNEKENLSITVVLRFYLQSGFVLADFKVCTRMWMYVCHIWMIEQIFHCLYSINLLSDQFIVLFSGIYCVTVTALISDFDLPSVLFTI